MRDRPWDPQRQFPWALIKERWQQVWDMSKPILVEKSPPTIVRAFEIEKFFSPCYFIATMRNPYAFCEGHRRRDRNDIAACAQAWVSHATYQVQSIKGLKNISYFKYEDFADNPAAIKVQILNFMPELKDINIKESFNARSMRGRGYLPIRNFNQEKIDRLAPTDIRKISAVLRQYEHLMSFFEYEYLRPTMGHSARYLKATVTSTALNKTINKTKRGWARLLRRDSKFEEDFRKL